MLSEIKQLHIYCSGFTSHLRNYKLSCIGENSLPPTSKFLAQNHSQARRVSKSMNGSMYSLGKHGLHVVCCSCYQLYSDLLCQAHCLQKPTASYILILFLQKPHFSYLPNYEIESKGSDLTKDTQVIGVRLSLSPIQCNLSPSSKPLHQTLSPYAYCSAIPCSHN